MVHVVLDLKLETPIVGKEINEIINLEMKRDLRKTSDRLAKK
jgi:hypothetical protein